MSQYREGILTVLMGVPGSGKSTWLKHLVLRTVVINPDTIREELTGDPNNQDRNSEVFAAAHARTQAVLMRGDDIVFDATNVKESARASLLKIAHDAGSFTALVVFDVPLDVAKKRNANRERVVPEHVLDRMQAQFEESLSQIGHEAWDSISFERIT